MKQLEALDRDYIWHPYTQMQLQPSVPLVVRGEGSYFYLADGHRVFDAISSWWVTLHGHAQPKIAAAIARQAATLEQVIFAGFTHEPAARLAEQILKIVPSGLTKAFFSDDGSTAVEVALKMAVQYWKHQGEDRRVFLAMAGCYHGDTFGAMSVSARSAFSAPFDPMLFAVEHLPFPTPPLEETKSYSAEESRFLEALESQCQSRTDIAAFIFEPLLLGAGGMKMWRQEILAEAMRIVKSHDILLVADEVLTGFGRTGTMFALETTGLSPDLMTLSKGLTGGFLPMGLTLTSQHIFDAFLSNDRAATFFHGHSYTANPISCAAALASLEIFESEPVCERIKAITQVHQQRIPQLAGHHKLTYRILGTIAVIEASAQEGYLSEKFRQVAKTCFQDGVLLRPLGDVLYFLPPFSSTETDLNLAYDVLDSALESSKT
jgi:adenosylmethionine-8-amino-7-oxononanoate aminotransferase